MCHLYFDDNGNNDCYVHFRFVCLSFFALVICFVFFLCNCQEASDLDLNFLDLFRCHLLGLSFVSRASKKET